MYLCDKNGNFRFLSLSRLCSYHEVYLMTNVFLMASDFLKVHVTNEKYEQYLGLADMSKFTTPHPEDTQIHACKYQVRISCLLLSTLMYYVL